MQWLSYAVKLYYRDYVGTIQFVLYQEFKMHHAPYSECCLKEFLFIHAG